MDNVLQDITMDLILSNATQLQDNQSHFKQSNLKTLSVDTHSRHNWTYDDPMRFLYRTPKFTN